MERTTLSLEEIWDQLSMGESQKFKVQKVLLLDRYKKRYSKDSNPRICDTKSVLQIDPISLVRNGIHCELTDMDTGRQMRVCSNKLRKVSLRRKPKSCYTTIFCVLIVLLFLTNICCVCFPVNPASNSLANIDTVPKDLGKLF
ncbi:hypothetical protein Ddc_23609 [Ditylenchus destructor]|nr:hypothetical protein Ddc_23609 [Ditylenchus destructor]